ncbi:substrate-binding domain-containing protein [Galbibacter sp. EGI 63066]|uniref:LacI family DNA-binding transcriptional regulator n=1 Tax=Galbibacter sp. EGI 63066 TaxID=2993559 RepID=UPI00224933F1|nr:substrate-binding domain-containing protein [Galbibacter sp. EGI 63066]MCX2680461.1 substrate-binding domain-containing protein [Galbibacter sp. EGI 63066]
MKKKRVSIKDIASDLNISVTTVSFVLNGKAEEKHISKELIGKVLAHVKKVNYTPNQIAQSLRTGESKILVFMVEDISNLFFAQLARLIEDLAYKKGYKVLFCSNDNDDKKSVELINLFKIRQVDGFILVSSPGIQNTINQLIEEHIPVVLLDRYFPGLNANHVITDNNDASHMAVCHFVENGFKNIAYITIDVSQSQMEDRLKGYRLAIKEHNLPEYTLQIPFQDAIKGNSGGYIRDFLKTNPDIDAILFATNYLLQSGLEVIKEKSSDLINKMGIITFDDNELFKTYSPTITVVAQPTKAMAEEAMELILHLIKNKKEEVTNKQIELKSSLIVRESSKQINT